MGKKTDKKKRKENKDWSHSTITTNVMMVMMMFLRQTPEWLLLPGRKDGIAWFENLDQVASSEQKCVARHTHAKKKEKRKKEK